MGNTTFDSVYGFPIPDLTFRTGLGLDFGLLLWLVNYFSSHVTVFSAGCGHSSSQPIPSQSYVMMEARLPRLTQPPASTLRREAEADTEEPIFHLEQMGAVKVYMKHI